MKASLSASQSVNQNHFEKTADRIFMKFCTKDKKVIQPGKILILGKKA